MDILRRCSEVQEPAFSLEVNYFSYNALIGETHISYRMQSEVQRTLVSEEDPIKTGCWAFACIA